MDLNRVTIVLRPRSPWQAIDLGGRVLACGWFLPLWRLWLLTGLPLLLLCFFLGSHIGLPDRNLGALLLFWLLKPILEPALLFWSSRAVFGEKMTSRKALKESRRSSSLWQTGALLLFRLSPMRSFKLPISFLESLDKRAKKQRIQVLRPGNEVALLLDLGCFFFEFLLASGLLYVLIFFLPPELRNRGFSLVAPPSWPSLFYWLYGLAVSVVSPFYVCCGFMIYLAKRVELEAWDLEIGFKKICNRLAAKKSGIAGIIALTLVTAVSGTPAEADNRRVFDRQEAKVLVDEVLSDKDFGHEKMVTRWVRVTREKDKKKDPFFEKVFEYTTDFLTRFFAPVIRWFGRYIIWILLAGLVLFFVWRILRTKGGGQWLSARQSRHILPQTPLTMPMLPEEMPADLEAACLQLFAEDRIREGLALLYRGTLFTLIHRCQLPVEKSYTEAQCSTLVSRERPEKESRYFQRLTAAWIGLAYGHRQPGVDECRELAAAWNDCYRTPGQQP